MNNLKAIYKHDNNFSTPHLHKYFKYKAHLCILDLMMSILVKGVHFITVFLSGSMHASIKDINPYRNHASTTQKMKLPIVFIIGTNSLPNSSRYCNVMHILLNSVL